MCKKLGLFSGMLFLILLYGCSNHDESQVRQPEYIEMNQETQDIMATDDMESVDQEPDSEAAPEPVAPTGEEVLAMREHVLEGMSEEEIERLTENIKTANLSMEYAYLYGDIFTKLADKESLYWNYFDQKGEIQIDWAFDGENFIDLIEEMKETVQSEALRNDLQQIMDYYLLRYGLGGGCCSVYTGQFHTCEVLWGFDSI